MSANILIFDSGVGGLSILNEIRQQLPGASLHYLMDNAAFPYGTKADAFLTPRILNVCTQAVRELQPDLLVIACNTASTLALPALRQRLSIPVVGVVPAIKVAAAQAVEGQIGLLATPATVNRRYTDDLIREFAPGREVARFGSSLLVQLAEDWIAAATAPDGLLQHLQNWLAGPPALTHVVLGCTHFPLLRPWLQQQWPHIHWIDSGAAIARRVITLLGERAAPLQQSTAQPLSLYWTDPHNTPEGVLHFARRQYGLDQHGVLAVEELPCT